MRAERRTRRTGCASVRAPAWPAEQVPDAAGEVRPIEDARPNHQALAMLDRGAETDPLPGAGLRRPADRGPHYSLFDRRRALSLRRLTVVCPRAAAGAVWPSAEASGDARSRSSDSRAWNTSQYTGAKTVTIWLYYRMGAVVRTPAVGLGTKDPRAGGARFVQAFSGRNAPCASRSCRAPTFGR